MTEISNVTEIDTVITSTDYPKHYKDNSKCKISIDIPNNTLLQLQFQEFNVEKHPKCIHDWLQINGSIINKTGILSANATIKKDSGGGIKICGNIRPPPITVNGSRIDLFFRSDGSISKNGVKLIVTNGTN